MRVLQLYRPRLPGLRAQAVQVVQAGHALARRGHTVTLLADRASPDATVAEALSRLGLAPVDGLSLRLAPMVWRPGAGLWFRQQVARWARGADGVVIARDKRRLVAARLPRRHRVILESHELDSLLAADRGDDPAPIRQLEARAAQRADALVANCGGTLAAWEESGLPLPAHRVVVHNGTAARPHPDPLDPVVRCLGSLRAYKGARFVLEACADWPLPLEWIGGTDAERASAPATTARLLAPVPQPDVARLLARATVVLVPLEDNLFGRRLTSPLKLWDALAVGRPVVAPDLPSIREIADRTGASLHLHAPGDRAGLAVAVRAAAAAPAPAPVVRSWDDRAAELESVLLAVTP